MIVVLVALWYLTVDIWAPKAPAETLPRCLESRSSCCAR